MASGGDFFHQGLAFGCGKVHERDLRALLGKGLDHGRANAGAAAGNEHALAAQAGVMGELGGQGLEKRGGGGHANS